MSVIIVGGGMTGATLALAISHMTQGQLPVHLVEAVAPEASNHPGFDARAIALAQGTCQQLSRIGIWQAIADRATAIGTVHVSDRGHAGFVTLDAQDYRIDALGQVVELHDVGLRLFRLLQDAPGVTLHCPARVASVSRSEASVSVTLENGTVLEGQLLVAADGSRSSLGTQCGVEWRQQPYGQVAVIANVATAADHNGRAFERFTQHGPLAMLPMSDGRCSLVWCHPQDKAEEVTNVFVPSCRKPLAGGWGVLPMPASGRSTRFRLLRRLSPSPIVWRSSVMPRRRCTLSRGKVSTLAYATS